MLNKFISSLGRTGDGLHLKYITNTTNETRNYLSGWKLCLAVLTIISGTYINFTFF